MWEKNPPIKRSEVIVDFFRNSSDMSMTRLVMLLFAVTACYATYEIIEILKTGIDKIDASKIWAMVGILTALVANGAVALGLRKKPPNTELPSNETAPTVPESVDEG